MLNQNYSLANSQANNAFTQACETQLPPQPWTGDVASALSAVTIDLSAALDALRSLDGRLFGVVPEPVLKGSAADKPQSIAADFSDRLWALRELAEALVIRAQSLNNRI